MLDLHVITIAIVNGEHHARITERDIQYRGFSITNFFATDPQNSASVKSRFTVIWATNHLGDNQLGDIFRSTGRHNFDYLGDSVGSVIYLYGDDQIVIWVYCKLFRPSVTRWYHAKTTPATIMRSSLKNSPMTLVFITLNFTAKFQREHRQRGSQNRQLLANRLSGRISETVQDRTIVTMKD